MKNNQMNFMEIKYSIWNKELIEWVYLQNEHNRSRISKFEDISKQRSMYMKHEEQRKTTENSEMSKKGNVSISLTYVSLENQKERRKDVQKLFLKK